MVGARGRASECFLVRVTLKNGLFMDIAVENVSIFVILSILGLYFVKSIVLKVF